MLYTDGSIVQHGHYEPLLLPRQFSQLSVKVDIISVRNNRRIIQKLRACFEMSDLIPAEKASSVSTMYDS